MASPLIPIEGEYVEVPLALVEHGYVKSGSIIECLLRRSSTANSRYWEYTKTISADKKEEKEGEVVPFPPAFGPVATLPSTERYIAWMSDSTYLSPSDLRWLPTAYTKKCYKCSDVSEKGEEDAQAGGAFRCEQCWKDSGYGDCVHCPKRFTPGSVDLVSKAFYCEVCWQSFASNVSIVHGAQPPPNGANLELQVMTRVAALLIDEVSRRFPLRDVLDLSITDTSVVRKWLYTGVESFTGVASTSQVANEVKAVKAQFLEDHPTKERENFHVFSCPYALTDLDRFWGEAIPARHPRQFSGIFCFNQLHKAFSTKESARDFFRYVARALVPGGMFVATFFCGNGYFSKGAPYRNDYFSLKWNIKEYEENRARMLAGLPQRGTSGDRSGLMSRTETMVGAEDGSDVKLATLGGARELHSSTPMPPTIDEAGADEDVPAAEDALLKSTSTVVPPPVVPTPPQPMTPIDDLDQDYENATTTSTTHTNPAATASPATPAPTPTTPSAQIKRESNNGESAVHIDPLSINATPASAAKRISSGADEESPNMNENDAPITTSSDAFGDSSATGAAKPAVAPLIPSKGAWKPKSLSTAAVSTAAAATASNPMGAAAASPQTPDETPLTTDLTVPTVGLTFQISFSEAGGSAAAGGSNSSNAVLPREGSSAVWTHEQTNSEVFTADGSPAASPTMPRSASYYHCPMFPEGLRTENAIPLDLLCSSAEESGLELLFDLWGKASDLIASDGSWTKPLNPAAKEYFNGVKTVVFKKIAKRPHASNAAAPAPAAL